MIRKISERGRERKEILRRALHRPMRIMCHKLKKLLKVTNNLHLPNAGIIFLS